MKIYLQPDTYSRGIVRVCDALMQYAPSSVELVQNPRDADYEIIHAYGRHDAIERRIAMLERKKKPYSIIQYAIRSTIRPKVNDWIRMWEKARVVWSYYDLRKLADEDLVSGEFNFYHAPLGVDPEIFKETPRERRFIVGACSQHALAEGARECSFASKRVQKPMFFLGHELRRGPDVVCCSNITDEEVANYWSQCQFVSGLRRIEGFEFPVIEGALCGARPIVFDRPHYRKWFNEFAIFIPEGSRDQVIDSLESIFKGLAVPITHAEKGIILDRFNWSRIINGFWKEALI